jgi:hypothetical protein
MVGDAAYEARVRGAPIFGDKRDHRVCAGLRRGVVVVARDAAEALATSDRCGRIVVLVGRPLGREPVPLSVSEP